jgi:hypothetical protein
MANGPSPAHTSHNPMPTGQIQNGRTRMTNHAPPAAIAMPVARRRMDPPARRRFAMRTPDSPLLGRER